MNHRQRTLAILNYESFDRIPVVHFGYWKETLHKWAQEGHITTELAQNWGDGNAADKELDHILGFDFDWYTCMYSDFFLSPCFERKTIEVLADGSRKVLNEEGVIVLEKPGAVSIPAEIDHTLKTRADWEEHYQPRLQWSEDRILNTVIRLNGLERPFNQGGLALINDPDREFPYGMHCGSLFGNIRNILGVVGASYLYAEDPELYAEIIDTVADLCYRCAETALNHGAQFDFAHFWEDICFKNGPLVIPSVFAELVGPHYKRITALFNRHDIHIVSLDCDGCIDALLPIWLENGVNTMFPIEVGTWNASIAPWRKQYGKELRGVGGMNKTVFSQDYAAVDAEIERLKPLVELGGYIPCPDHRIAPDSKWDNVRYYCDHMHSVFG